MYLINWRVCCLQVYNKACFFSLSREDEPQKLPMNSKDRTASPARKCLIPLPRPNNPQEQSNNLVNNGLLANNRPVSEFHPPPGSMVDSNTGNGAPENKTTLKIHLVDGGFNVVKCSDTTDIKVNFTCDIYHGVSILHSIRAIRVSSGDSFFMDTSIYTFMTPINRPHADDIEFGIHSMHMYNLGCNSFVVGKSTSHNYGTCSSCFVIPTLRLTFEGEVLLHAQ